MGFFDKFIKKDSRETSSEIAISEKGILDLADQYLLDTETDLSKEKTIKMPIAELSTLGIGVASLMPSLRTVTQTSMVNTSGLYRLANKSVTDTLKVAKNGNFWGAFHKAGGGSKFAQLVEAGPLTATTNTVMPLDPATMMMAVALYSIEKQLGYIAEMEKQILSFLETEKESQIEADVQILTNTIREYKYNWDKELFIQGHYQQALTIKRNAGKDIRFYQKEIQEANKSSSVVVAKANVNSSKNEMEKKYRYYRMALYLYSLASFLEVMLLGDFREEHILQIENEIEEHSMKYRELFAETSNYMEKIAGKSVESNVLRGIGIAGKAVGNLIGSIPLVKEGPVDEWLIEGGSFLKRNADEMEKDAVHGLLYVSDPGTKVFLDKMETMNQIYNHTKGICFDKDNIYMLVG